MWRGSRLFEIKFEGTWYKFEIDRNQLIIKMYNHREKRFIQRIGTFSLIINKEEKEDLIECLKF